MTSIRKGLLQLVFSGSYMNRWNDKLRPMELWEVDKQAHKMIVAWMLFLCNTRSLPDTEKTRVGNALIEGGVFEYFYRLVITDIKPPVFYQIKANPEHYEQLTHWLLSPLHPRVRPLGGAFWDRLEAYFLTPSEEPLAAEILEAAHMWASSWEFQLIKGVNPWDDELGAIEANFAEQLAAKSHLHGLQEIMAGPHTALGRLAHLCGQLRFQKRWSQIPRIPETSVLGHMFIVATYAFCMNLVLQTTQRRRMNTFFTGLFHDLPELLTRDIISPVKRSVQPIAEMIKEYEHQEMSRRVFAPLQDGGHEDVAQTLSYYLGLEVGSEFADTVRTADGVQSISWEEFATTWDREEYDPKDGRVVKVSDHLAAFIEAYTSIRNGINADQLQQALWRLRTQYSQVSLGELHIGALLADFD